MTAPSFAVDVYFSGDVSIGPSTQLGTPTVFCLNQREFSHEVLDMQYWGGDVQSFTLATGQPVWVSWGRPPAMRIFYGYINHAGRVNNQLSQDRDGRNSINVHCVGASWVLKDRASSVYSSLTNTQIVSAIVSQYNLGQYVVPSTGNTGSSKQQGGLSYWEWMVQLMQEIGYTLYPDGIQIVAKPRQTNPRNLSNLAATYDYSANPAGLPIFNPVLGSNSPAGGQLRNRVNAGIDVQTLQPYVTTISGSNTSSVLGTQQEPPPFTEIEQMTTQNISQSVSKLQGVAQANQMYLTATAVGPGNSNIAPGQVIYVQNANGSQNGLWWVCGVEHHMIEQTYTMTMNLGRDSVGTTQLIQVMPQTSFPEETANLVQGQWQAAAA